MANLSDPRIYSVIEADLIDQGFDPKEVRSQLSQRVAREQALAALNSGLIDPEQALSAVGGIGQPGALQMLQGSGLDQANMSPEARKKAEQTAQLSKIAKNILKTLDDAEQGKISGEELRSRINYLGSEYNSAKGFDTAGTAFTEGELALLAGSLLTPEIRKQNLIQKATGYQPPQTGNILDSPEEIRRKMELALETMGVARDEEEKDMGCTGIDNQVMNDLVFASQEDQTTPQNETNQNTNIDLANTDKSLGGFTQNIMSDAGENIQGILSLPGVAKDIATGQIPVQDAVEAVVGGIANEYIDLATKPVDTIYEKPITSAMNLAPAIGKLSSLSKASKAGKISAAAKAVDSASDIGRTSDKIADIGRTADKIADTARLVEKTDRVSPVARNIYQSALSISKKNNSFEKLKPAQTVDSMIKYRISGNADDIYKKASQISGPDGIATNIVGDAVARTTTPVSIDSVYQLLDTSKTGRFSALDPSKIDELKLRTSQLQQNHVEGKVDVSRLLDYERQLQEEAVMHGIAGMKGDTAANELSKLKFELADEISSIIDTAVADTVDLSQYKTPEVIALVEEVSPELAKDFANANTIKEMRSLQRDFVRIKQMIELSQQEASGISQRLFGTLDKVPVVGPGLQAVTSEMSVPINTRSAVAIDQASPAIEAVKSATLNPYTPAVGRQFNNR